MLWLSEKEAFQALKRFKRSASPIAQSRFKVLSVKVRDMLAKGARGVEVDEDFLDSPLPVVAKRSAGPSPLVVGVGLLALEYMFGDQRLRHNRAMRSLFG